MDTDVGDLQNGLLDVQEAMRQTLVSLKQKQKKIEHSTTTSSIWYLYNYSSSYFEIPVKPGVPDTTSIRLYPNSSVAHPSASATRLYLDVYEGCRYVDEISMTWICKRESKRETRERERESGGEGASLSDRGYPCVLQLWRIHCRVCTFHRQQKQSQSLTTKYCM